MNEIGLRKIKINLNIELTCSLDGDNDNVSIIEDTLSLFNNKTGSEDNFTLNKAQHKMLSLIENNNYSIIRKTRQAGADSLLNAVIACEVLKNNKQVIFFGPNERSIFYNTSKIYHNIEKIINKLKLDVKIIKHNKSEIVLSNGSNIRLKSLSSYDCSGFINVSTDKKTWFIFNEVAFAENAISFYNEIKYKNFNVEKIILVSNQNGIDKLFFPLYILGEKAGFKTLHLPFLDSNYNVIKHASDLIIKNNKSFEFEFGDSFVVLNGDKIKLMDIERLIQPHLLPGNNFTIMDMVKLIKSNKIMFTNKEIYGVDN